MNFSWLYILMKLFIAIIVYCIFHSPFLELFPLFLLLYITRYLLSMYVYI